MVNGNYFVQFLNQRNIACSYQVWIKSAERNVFYLYESIGNGSTAIPKQAPDYEKVFQSINKELNQTDLWMKYPGEFQLCIRLNQILLFTDEELIMIYHYFYPYYSDYSINTNKNNLDKIIQTTQDISSSLDLDNLLNKIIANALSVIPAADFGTLWMYDPDIDFLVCRACAGDVHVNAIKNMRIKQGEGIVGKVFVSGVAKLYRNFDDIMQDTLDFSEANANYLESSFSFLRKRLQKSAVLSMPVKVNGKTECVMMMYQTQSDLITETDIQLLSAFCNQVAIALINARMFAGLKEQNDILKKRDEIHSTLTEISIQNKGVESIIKSLSKIINIPMGFIDLIENEIYTENFKLSGKFNYDQFYRLLIDHESPFIIDLLESGKPTHTVFPIKTGSAYLGCLTINAQVQLKRLDLIAIEQANSILTLEIIKNQSILDIHYKKIYESFIKLMQSENNPVAQQLWLELGIEPEAFYTMVLFEFNFLSDPYILEITMHNLIAQIQKEMHRSCKLIFGFNTKVYLLATTANSTQTPGIVNRLNNIVKDIYINRGVSIRACAGSLYHGNQSIKKSYNEAIKGLSYQAFHNNSGLIEYSNIGLNRLFINYSNDDIMSFLKETFDPLRTSKNKNIRLEETLVAFIQCNRSAKETSKKLHIHINTLYQRLSKIEQLLDLSFDNPENVLQVSLACYLKQSYEY